MPKLEQPSFLRSPVRFDLKRIQAVYQFAMGLKGLNHEGLSNKAAGFEDVLKQGIETAFGEKITTTEQVKTYINAVIAVASDRLQHVVQDQRYAPGSSVSKRRDILDSFERIANLMGMTMSIALQLLAAKQELKELRSRAKLHTISQVSKWVRSGKNAPILNEVSTLQGTIATKIKSALVIAHALGLDVGDTVRKGYGLAK